MQKKKVTDKKFDKLFWSVGCSKLVPRMIHFQLFQNLEQFPDKKKKKKIYSSPPERQGSVTVHRLLQPWTSFSVPPSGGSGPPSPLLGCLDFPSVWSGTCSTKKKHTTRRSTEFLGSSKAFFFLNKKKVQSREEKRNDHRETFHRASDRRRTSTTADQMRGYQHHDNHYVRDFSGCLPTHRNDVMQALSVSLAKLGSFFLFSWSLSTVLLSTLKSVIGSSLTRQV